MTALQSLLRAIQDDLGDPAHWQAPVEYPDSLALCALNSAYTLQATSTSVVNVITRYRQVRPSADTDSGPDLIQAMDEAGGPETFARDGLRNATVLPGTSRVRTIGIYEALTRLAEVGVTTASELRSTADKTVVRKAWRSVHGLGPQSWAYLLMNAGVETETKPDRMLQRYVTRAVGSAQRLSPPATRKLILAAADELGVTPRRLDRAIWWHESPFGG